MTAAELREEVEKAKAFKPKLSHWVLATTARKDNAIEELARIITEDHRASGHFRVQVLGWEDLRSLIAEYPEVMGRALSRSGTDRTTYVGTYRGPQD